MLRPNKNQSLKVLGIMSGTSLDALDLALCSFEQRDGKYRYNILQTLSHPLSLEWQEKLSKASQLSASEFHLLENEYSSLYVSVIREFQQNASDIDLIAAHGQTIFHAPEKGLTYQMLNPGLIYAQTNIPVVADFRRENVAQGGQGAPLVPIGDELLFSAYHACLNLGGFANVSYRESGKRIAFDIVFCNRISNHLSRKQGLDYDKNGRLAKQGKVDESLLNQLNDLAYYKTAYPKSLGEEFLEQNVYPILEASSSRNEDLLRTVVEHISIQIGNNLRQGKCLVSGGGAKNQFLIERIKSSTDAEIVVANDQLLEFKEALIFSFLGYLRVSKQINVFGSSTGTENDMIVGAVYGY